MHGCITGAFKNQIDWLPLNTGSVRPTQWPDLRRLGKGLKRGSAKPLQCRQ